MSNNLSTSPAQPFQSPVPFPVKIVNNSGSKKEVYIIVKGMDGSITNNNKQQFYDLANKKWVNSVVSTKLSSLPASKYPTGNIVYLPYIESGIVYFSFDKSLQFNNISPPDFANPSNPSFDTIYDKFEISFLKTDGFPYIDITNVDFFCVPLQLEMMLANGTIIGPKGFKKSQKKVFAAFTNGLTNNNWEEIKQEVTTSTGKTKTLRVAAPNKALVQQPPKTHNFEASDFQHYVDYVWQYYDQSNGKSIKVDMSEIASANPAYDNVVFEGMVINGKFTFSGKNAQGNSLPSIEFDKPVGSDLIKNSIFGCANLFEAPNNTPKSVPAKNLGAAFNVGILAHPKIKDATLYLMPPITKLSPKGKNWTTYKSYFYTNTKVISLNTNPVTYKVIDCYNVYAAIIHENAINGDDYAFAFDDVTLSDSTLANKNAAKAVVTIQKLA
jgi:hypothetical protein